MMADDEDVLANAKQRNDSVRVIESRKEHTIDDLFDFK
jgi:hypothetical protein